MKRIYLGSNQYKKRNSDIDPRVQRNIWIIFILCTIVALAGFSFNMYKLSQNVKQTNLSLLTPQVFAESISPVIDTTHKDGVIALIKKIWGKHAHIGIALSQCESGLNSQAKHINNNGTIDEGAFQVNSIHGLPDMKVATANILYAYSLYKEQGLNPWNASKKCWGDKI